ncbi:MAG: hypothetical protein ACRDMY_11065 [Gaiellaceae bacterium]
MSFADFLACMRQVVYDYEPAETPAQFMRQAGAVVTGTIVEMKAGRSYASTPASRDLDAVSVLEVKVDRVLAGDRTVVADGFVSICRIPGASTDASKLQCRQLLECSSWWT